MSKPKRQIIKTAFIGLGVMGYPMAGHLHKAGHTVAVYNRTAAKAEAWAKEQGLDPATCVAPTPAVAAEGCDMAMTCVGNDADVRAVVLGADGALAGLPKGGMLIDHTTASAKLARELDAAARAQGKCFLDAPVSGGQAGAENGTLTIMAGGTPADFARAEPVLTAYAKFSKLQGPAGCGQLAKMVNQICIAGVVQGLAEGLDFAKRAGLDGPSLIETIAKGAAGSWQMENRWQTMLADKYDFGFAVDWMRKDLAMAFAEAEANGAQLSLAKMVDEFYAEVQAMGGGRWDTSSLLARLARRG